MALQSLERHWKNVGRPSKTLDDLEALEGLANHWRNSLLSAQTKKLQLDASRLRRAAGTLQVSSLLRQRPGH